jgi:hypothetical protein
MSMNAISLPLRKGSQRKSKPAEIFKNLEKHLEQSNKSGINECLSAAQEMRLDPAKYGILRKAKEFMSMITSLEDALRLKEIESLDLAIKAAEKIQYDGPEVIECKNMRTILEKLELKANYAVKRLEIDEMKAVIDESEQLSFINDDILKMRDVLNHTSPEKLTQLQLKAAIAIGDSERVSKLMYSVKEQFFEKMGDFFLFSKYPRLKEPIEFAESKLFASSNEKEKLASTYLWYSSDPIHTSILNDLSFLQVNDAKKIFKAILDFMKMGDPESALYIVTKVIQNIALRSEVYCQLVKQLTHNEINDEKSRVWDLMNLCLYLFPPGDDLENYLELWLRQNSKNKELSLGRLYLSVTKGGVTRNPSAYHIAAILSSTNDSEIISVELELGRRKVSASSPRVGSPLSRADTIKFKEKE